MVDDFIRRELIDPILNHVGYTPLTTALYSFLALWSIDVIYDKFFKGMSMDDWFLQTIFTFILWGSSFRVLVDAHIVPYTFWSTSPGIYLVVASIFFWSIVFLSKKAYWVGGVLAVPSILLILGRLKYPLALLIPLAMAALPALMVKKELKWVVFAHALDGAATFYAMDIVNRSPQCLVHGICYFEQHVLTRFIGETFGTYLVFYLLKVGLAYVITDYILKHLEPGRARYYRAIIFLMGLAPGLRDVFRLSGGT